MKFNSYISPLTRSTGKSISKFQNSGNTGTVDRTKVDNSALSYTPKDEDEAWIMYMLAYERLKGLADGTGMTNYGINNPLKYAPKKVISDLEFIRDIYGKDSKKFKDEYEKQKSFFTPKNMAEAVKIAKDYFLNRFKDDPNQGLDLKKLPTSVRQRVGDYIFNSGRNPRHLLLLASGLITLNEINDATEEIKKYKKDSPQYKAAVENHTKRLNSLWEENKDKILKNIQDNPEAFSKSLDKERHAVAKTTNPIKDSNDNIIGISSAYDKTWKDRIDMWSVKDKLDSQYEQGFITDPDVIRNVVYNTKKNTNTGNFEVENEVAKIATSKNVKSKQNIGQASQENSQQIAQQSPNQDNQNEQNTQTNSSVKTAPTTPAAKDEANPSTPITAPSQPAAANDNQQVNTQPPAQNTQQNTQGTVNPPANTGVVAPNQVGTQVVTPPVSSTENTPPATPPAASPATPPAAPTAPQYIDITPERGDTSYEYRYDKTNKRWETRKKGGEWIILDDSTERKKAAREAIEKRYGSQTGKFLDALKGRGKEETKPGTDGGADTGTGASAGTGTGAATGTDAGVKAETGVDEGTTTGTGTGTVSTGQAPIQNVPTQEGDYILDNVAADVLSRYDKEWDYYFRKYLPNRRKSTQTTTVNGTVPSPQGTSTNTGGTSVGQGPVNGTVPPQANAPIGGTTIPPSSIGQGGVSGGADKRDVVNIPTIPTSPLRPISPSKPSSANIATPTVKDNAVRIKNIDLKESEISDIFPSDFRGFYGKGNKTYYQTKDGAIKIVTDGRGNFYLENEDKLYRVDPPDGLFVGKSITGHRLDEDTSSFVKDPEYYDEYWEDQLKSIKEQQKKGISSKEFYGKNRRQDYGDWNYRRGGFMQGGEIPQLSIGGGIAKGASTGATLGAALGTVVPGLGNVVGGAVGALVGGIAGGISGGVKQNREKREARRQELLSRQNQMSQQRMGNTQSLLGLLGGNNSFSSLLRGPNLPATQPQMGMQGNPYMQGALMSPYMAQLMPPPFQEGAEVTPTIYINETAPEKYSTGLNDQLYSNPYSGKAEINMDALPIGRSSYSGGERTIIIPDEKTGKNYEAVIDREGNIKQVKEVGSSTFKTPMSAKQEYDKSWEEIMSVTNPPQKQQGGVPLVGLPSRRFFQNSMQKNYDSMNKNVVESVIRGEPVNLSRNQALNPYRLNPMGAFKTGGLITEWSNSAKRAGFTRQPISGGSSQGPMGPKSSQVPSYTNAGVRALIDLPSNEYIPTENLIPIQTEKGEMIVLPTGDLMPVMARKRHHQMADDEVTDVAPENSYILSAHGQVRINRDEADLIITETGVKPYRLGMKQDPPTEKTLASIMSRKSMKPAEIAKKINNMFPVLSTRNPFEIAANNENKVNRKPYLEGLIQLSELDKVRKGLAEPSETDQQQMMALQSNQGSPMLAKQGGRAISYIGVPKAQNSFGPYDSSNFGGNPWLAGNQILSDQAAEAMGNRPYTITPSSVGYYGDPTSMRTFDPIQPGGGVNAQAQQSGSLLGTIAAPLNFGARLIASNAIRKAEKRGIARERGIYDQGFNRMGTLMGVGTGMEAAMLGAQDPFVQFRETPDTYFRQMRTQTPSQVAEARANMTFANLPDYSNMGMAGLAASNAAYAQGLGAANQALLATQEADRAAYNQQQAQLQQLLAQNVAGRLAAERATTANINRILSGYGGLANRFTQGQLDLTGQRMGANLGLSRAEQASKVNLYGNRLGAFTTFTGDVVSSGEGGLKALSGLLGLG